jgi:hypothetical protein
MRLKIVVDLFTTEVVLFGKIRLKMRLVFAVLTVNDYAKFKFRYVCKNQILKCEEYIFGEGTNGTIRTDGILRTNNP